MTGTPVAAQKDAQAGARKSPQDAADSGRQRRVVAVRCPAWGSPSQPASPASASQAPAGQVAGPDLRAFERVVSAVEEFCPRIEVLRPGICAFGARGPARYFGGEAELARKIVGAVAGLGFDCGVGIADGLFAALLASRDSLLGFPAPVPDGAPVKIVPSGGTPAYLAPRLVTVLGEPELADLLVRLGIRTLGEFAALPAAEAGNRFGAQGLIAHRLARGLDPRPLATRPPSADLSVQIEFDPAAEQSERVAFAAKALAGQMHARLAASGLACVRLEVQLICEDGQEITRLWRHDGLLSELAVAERVRWQLDGWLAGRPDYSDHPGTGSRGAQADEGIQAGGISLLRLIPDQLVHDQGRQLGLWGDAIVSDRVARAAIRVQAMLGHDAVRQPVPVGGRSPSDQVRQVPFGDTPATRPMSRPASPLASQSGAGPAGPAGPADRPVDRPVDRPWPGRIPPPAPATVYPAPRPARVTDSSGAPVTVTGRGMVSAEPVRLSVAGGRPLAITAWTGPWPVTERWWDPAHACRKARFQLVTIDGDAWLAVVVDGQWLIEASYD
jgi:protein ImuB